MANIEKYNETTEKWELDSDMKSGISVADAREAVKALKKMQPKVKRRVTQ